MLVFHQVGNFGPEEVQIEWSPDSRRRVPELEQLVEDAWSAKLSEPGIKLFDGPMCRLERWEVRESVLRLVLSRTSYKPFFGTNLSHPELATRYGREILANPVGVSPALITTDGFLMFGRRNGSVAYYPDRIHPFAGALEPSDRLDVFEEVMRELREELSLAETDVRKICCTGIAEDVALKQPEMIFAVWSTRTQAEIVSMVKEEEHTSSWSCNTDVEAINEALRSQKQFTPVAVASILLWGRLEFGEDWLHAQAKQFL